MEFNTFLWQNYKESKSGNELIHFFETYFTTIITEKKYDYYQHLRTTISYKGTLEINFKEYVENIGNMYYALTHDQNNTFIPIEIKNIDDAEIFYKNIFSLQFVDKEGKIIEEPLSSDDVPFFSEVLYAVSPSFFFPYYFTRLYQDVIEFFDTFGIFLPPVPRKNDKNGRINHYLELCKSLYQFRIKNGLNEFELPAFLYGFAINIIKRYKVSEELPTPRKAYFVGGGKRDRTVDSSGDFDYLDKATYDSVSNWNGDPETQVGDIIVMYCLSPRSYIHSIWRAVTPGSFDPFFHYYKNVNIGKPIIITPITIEEIKNDPILSEMSLVKANMQGINGRNIPKKYYDRLLKLLNDKGQDISLLPRPPENEIKMPSLENEHDVEEKLLEPLLLQLGYKQENWKRQMKLRMGRGEKVYPDYVIFPNEERNNESCYWVWEAKYTINSHRQLAEDFGQAKSYALRLKSKGMGLVSQEGIWLSTPDYSLEKVLFWSWKQISDHDTLTAIFDMAGNKEKIRKNA